MIYWSYCVLLLYYRKNLTRHNMFLNTMICSLNLGYIIDHPDSYKPNTPLDLHIKISSSPLKQTHVLPYQICLKWYITFPCKKKKSIKRTRGIISASYNCGFCFFNTKILFTKRLFSIPVCEGGWFILCVLLLCLHLEINYHIIVFALPLAN